MSSFNAYEKYKAQSVNTLTPGELIIRLYEEAAANITKAIQRIEEKNIAEAHNSIIRAQDIFFYLAESLDMSYPLSKDLFSLYDYICNTLVDANLKKDAELLRGLLTMTQELKDAWKQAEMKVRVSKASAV